jgi:hypothetical protein
MSQERRCPTCQSEQINDAGHVIAGNAMIISAHGRSAAQIAHGGRPPVPGRRSRNSIRLPSEQRVSS